MDPRKIPPETNPSSDPAAPETSVQDDQKNAESSAAAAKKPVVKKRTKTGCYTCRRRRIKCDEGKPRCNNCIKSKRQCDGYNQRVIFKDPMGTFQTNQMGMGFQGHPSQGLLDPQSQIASQGVRTASQGSLPFIAPRPPMLNDATHQLHHQHNPYQPLPMHGLPNFSQMPPPPMPTLNPNAMPYVPSNQPYGHGQQPPSFLPEWRLQAGGLTGTYVADPGFLEPMSYNGEPSVSPPVAASMATSVGVEERVSAARMIANRPPPRAVQIADAPDEHHRGDVYLGGPSEAADQQAYWFSDDDASMADSDDNDLPDEMEHLQSNDLGVIVAGRLLNRPIDTFGTQLRTFANFADANLLTNYFPSSSSSPLTDPKTAAVFWYFVNVTGPSISLFERHPVNPTPVFEGRPVPRSRQHIWTYTFPNIALNHPALLQAMLALGSLHMAKLQGVPATASMKHYHLSLRRIARNYQSASRRVQPATLAATMLLGFYEVWNSDHDKWCKHMWGARAILKEIPLREMTKDMISLKRNERQQLHLCAPELRASLYENANVAERDIDQVDPQLVAQIYGQAVRFLQDDDASLHSFMSNPGITYTTPKHYTQRDIEIYQMFCDLFWWYCKMDVYQSILGGTRLLMDYKFWTQCCPRTPIGLIDAAYGTYDHLVLLLGRLCHFSSRDQARKRMAKKPDGPPGPPGQGHSPPPFVGMMPTTGRITIPKGFSPPREESPESDNQEELDFGTRTAAALDEWESIKEAFEFFRAQLGSNFDPLGPEYEPAASSPFGLVLKYRTYSVASIWMNYYMGLIILYRCHPSMPHIAMAAAAMSARQTAPYANEIGRIVAGLTVDDLSTLTKVSTLLGAVSIESSFPLFVAAVQYQDTIQRHWTVRRLHNVARLTGWQSARQIAIGCETGWTKAASMGRGPPYQSPTDVVEVPHSIWNRPKRIIDRIRELEEDDKKLVLSATERPHYALGLLTMEADLEKLELSDG